ncbi:MAG: ATP-binding protein [Xanthobacteraceae bacterium]
MTQPRSLNFLFSLAFLFFFVLVTALGSFSIQRLSEFNRASADLRDIWLPNTRFIGDLNNFTSDLRAAEGRHLLSSTPTESASNMKEIETIGEAVAQAQRGYESVRHSPSASELYGQFKEAWLAYHSAVDHVLDLYNAGKTAEAIDLYRTTSQAAYNAASDLLDRLTRLNVASAAAASDQADAAYRSARALITLAMIIAAVLVIVALLYVNRFISAPLRDLARGMRRLAANDTDIEVKGYKRVDEIGEMARALLIFRANAIELMLSQRSLSQQASMLEEKLEQEQRLVQLQQDFVSMASHEFRTPLTIIDGQAQRLIKTGGVAASAEIAERARKVRRAVLRMTTTIDHLLDSARLIDGETSLYFHPAEIELRGLLEEVCHLHREIAPQSNVWQDLGTTPLPILGDAKLLFQMFGNLVSNALKYSPDGSLVEVTARIEAGNVAVTVRDRGIGIPAGDLAKIFGRYNRGSNVSGIVGTGVGLFLVKMVVELHGGSITVESVEEKGTTFRVLLPLLRAA